MGENLYYYFYIVYSIFSYFYLFFWYSFSITYHLFYNGCIAYDVFESATRKDVLMICETWKDAESLDAHEKAAHFVTLVPKLQELGNMKLEKFEF